MIMLLTPLSLILQREKILDHYLNSDAETLTFVKLIELKIRFRPH